MEGVNPDDVYRNRPLKDIPWNIEYPPAELVGLVETGTVKPCMAIDLGCGAGNYSIYLAGKGFDVTGVDISPEAIRLAKKNARKKKANCSFVVADLTDDPGKFVKGKFGFALEWEMLHHLFPEQRRKYAGNVHALLDPGALFFSVCFSDQDRQFGGAGKYRTTSIGTVLYFSSGDEIRELFEPFFDIIEIKTIEIPGKTVPHMVNYSLLKRKPG
jgi:cyclopropane fatty-acyl-phospholipid synthase-like methyltransferase